jgi:hypothetical protein
VPVWASALVTVIAALGAGTGGALLTLRHNRLERFRGRMIEAADDYANASGEALLKLRDAVGVVERSTDADAKIAAVELAMDHRDTALKRASRIFLLFGPESEASKSVARLVNHLIEGADLLVPKPDKGIQSDARAASTRLQNAADEHEKFYALAYEEIRRARPPSETVREALRRRLKKPPTQLPPGQV